MKNKGKAYHPMNDIIGMSHLTLQTDLNDKQKNYIQKIDFDMFKLVDDVVTLMEFSINEKNLELSVSYDEKIARNFS